MTLMEGPGCGVVHQENSHISVLGTIGTVLTTLQKKKKAPAKQANVLQEQTVYFLTIFIDFPPTFC